MSNNSYVRKAVHNKDTMKNITLIHIDFLLCLLPGSFITLADHEQCHPTLG